MEYTHIFFPAVALFCFAIGILYICLRDSLIQEIEDKDEEESECPICGRIYKGEYCRDMVDDHIYTHMEE